LKFIVDTQLPPKLSTFLKQIGLDSIHTSDFNKGHLLNDSEIIDIAKSQSRIIITKDKDFYDYFFLFGPPPKVLLLKVGNINNENLIELFKTAIQKVIFSYENDAGLIMLTTNEIISF